MQQQQQEEEVNLNDLPLPPPPSPTQLQQYEELCANNNNNNNNSINSISNNNSIPGNQNHIPSHSHPHPHPPQTGSYHARTLSSLSSMSSGSNTTHSSTHSLSPTPYCNQQQQQQMSHLSVDMTSNDSSILLSLDQCGSMSPMHSRQTSSSSCGPGIGENNNMTVMPPTPPPPPPPTAPFPLPITKDNNNQKEMYIKNHQNTNTTTTTNVKLMTKQNENDMNSYNKATSAAVAAAAAAAAASGGGLGNQKAYNKFLKEYSNKLITQQNNGNNKPNNQQNFSDNNREHIGNTNNTNNNTNNTISNIITNINVNRPHNPTSNSNSNSIVKPFPLKQTFKTLQQQQPQSPQQQQQKHFLANISNNNNNNNNNGLTNVAALTATLNNQLKFDSCQVAPTPCSNIPIVDKSLINSNSNSNISNSNSNSNININNNININTTNSTSIDNKTTFTNDTTSASAVTAIATTNMMAPVPLNGVEGTTAGGGDKPFEYVTLTGNVIRSVVPPGKGAVPNYKVNQGYVRPFGAAPPSAAPKSPVSFPPQQQQWNAPPPTQPKPVVGGANPYATLPRTNAGPQESLTKPSLLSDTLPRPANANRKPANAFAPQASPLQQTDLGPQDDPTAMLNESIGKIQMGNKMNNFMAEAGKVISNMLEARLANGAATNSSPHGSCANLRNGMPSPHSGSSLSLRSNSSSNLSRSPMVVRKRLDLDDFKDINPTEPAALKPVIALQQQQPTVDLKPTVPVKDIQMTKQSPYTNELNANHPMGKVLDICDNKFKPASPLATRSKGVESGASAANSLPPSETVIYRNNDRSNRRASHATDRRSYIETNAQTNERPKDGPVFSINVKALGKPGEEANKPMSPENEEVVSQLLKEGKKPICCQCNNEITSGPFITALGKIWCPEHFHCVNGNCRRPLQDIGFVEEKGDLYCEYCFEKYLAPTCSKCSGKIKGDCLNAIGKHFHPECFSCGHCGKLFGNTPFFLEDGMPYCEADWNELFTTKCFACGFPVEAGDRWVEALNHNYHSQCFNCTYCKQNLEGQSFYNKGGRPFCKNHAR